MPFEYAWSVVLADCSELELEFSGCAEVVRQEEQPTRPKQRLHPPLHGAHHALRHLHVQLDDLQRGLGGQECHWYLKSVMCDNTKRCAIFQHGYHISIVMSPPRVRLNLSVKRFVREQTDVKLMQSRMLNKMIDEFSLDGASDYLPRVQLYSHYYRTSKLADSNNAVDMEALIVTKPFHPNLDDKTSFAYGYPTRPNGDPFLTTHSSYALFVVGFSCKCLIRNLAHAAPHVLRIDATFKLNTCNFPVVVLSVSDSARHFHPVCFFTTSDLKQQQIECVVRSTVLQYQSITGSLPEIRFVRSDADQAQRNAVEVVMTSELNNSSPDFLICFFHVMKDVKKYATGMSVPSRTLAFRHVYRMHYVRTAADLDAHTTPRMTFRHGESDLTVSSLNASSASNGSLADSLRVLVWCHRWDSKTNNPVEHFNKMLKCDYTLRRRINVNMLAQELLELSKHQAARQPSFELELRPSDEHIRRYKALKKADRLVVTSEYLSSVSCMISGNESRRFRVIQRGEDHPCPLKREQAIVDEHARVSEYELETFQQPSSGWIVDVGASTCQCRTWFKLAYCVHLIAARVHIDLFVEGVTKKRKFVNKSTKKKAKGAIVGHALPMV